jgi:type I restriction-modification system DNA methylase subunit
MVGEFAAEAGKKAGSFFTPSAVSELMGSLTAPRRMNPFMIQHADRPLF